MYNLQRFCRYTLYLVFFITGCNGDDLDLRSKLTIEKTGNGAGRVTSSPKGISCGDDCSDKFFNNIKITLRATAAEGSVFTGWNHDGCSGTGSCVVTLKESKTITANFNPTLAGVWEVKGNGFLIDVNPAENAYDWYEITEKSLLLAGRGTIADGEFYYRDNVAITVAEVLEASEKSAVLPSAEITAPTQDPEDNFEVFWQTFERYYAFFDLLTDTSWQTLYDQYRPRINQHTTAEELWNVFAAMIAALNDGHTRLFDFAGGKSAASRDVNATPSSWMMDKLDVYVPVIAASLDTFSAEENVLGNGNVLFGTINENIGYLNIFAYDGYADTPLSPFEFSLLHLLSASRRDVEPYADMLDTVFTRFADMDALIIDLRFNRGGSGDLTKELASRLTGEKFHALSHQMREEGYDDYYPEVQHVIEPGSVSFLGQPIIVLTSSNTVSAGDWQVLILKELPNVTVLGEKTFGIFSEGIPRQLPNGWYFTLSTQRVYSAGGDFYEQKGIAPDIAVAADADSLDEGVDNMLRAALEELGVYNLY